MFYKPSLLFILFSQKYRQLEKTLRRGKAHYLICFRAWGLVGKLIEQLREFFEASFSNSCETLSIFMVAEFMIADYIIGFLLHIQKFVMTAAAGSADKQGPFEYWHFKDAIIYSVRRICSKSLRSINFKTNIQTKLDKERLFLMLAFLNDSILIAAKVCQPVSGLCL